MSELVAIAVAKGQTIDMSPRDFRKTCLRLQPDGSESAMSNGHLSCRDGWFSVWAMSSAIKRHVRWTLHTKSEEKARQRQQELIEAKTDEERVELTKRWRYERKILSARKRKTLTYLDESEPDP